MSKYKSVKRESIFAKAKRGKGPLAKVGSKGTGSFKKVFRKAAEAITTKKKNKLNF